MTLNFCSPQAHILNENMVKFTQLFDHLVDRKIQNVIGNLDGGLYNESNIITFNYGFEPDIDRLSAQAEVFAETVFTYSFYWRRLFNLRNNEDAKIALYKIYIYSFFKAICSSLYFSDIPENREPSFVLYGHAVLFFLMTRNGVSSEILHTKVHKKLFLTDAEKKEVINKIANAFPFLKSSTSLGHRNNVIVFDPDLESFLSSLVLYEDRSTEGDFRLVSRPEILGSNSQQRNVTSSDINTEINGYKNLNKKSKKREGERSPNIRFNGNSYYFVDLYKSSNYTDVKNGNSSPFGNAYMDVKNSCWYYAYSSGSKVSSADYSFCKANFFTLKSIDTNLCGLFSVDYVDFYDKLPILNINNIDRSIKYEVYAISMVKPAHDPSPSNKLRSLASKTRFDRPDPFSVISTDKGFDIRTDLREGLKEDLPKDSEDLFELKDPTSENYQQDSLDEGVSITSNSNLDNSGIQTSLELSSDDLDFRIDKLIKDFYNIDKDKLSRSFNLKTVELINLLNLSLTDKIQNNLIKRKVIQGYGYFSPKYKYAIDFRKRFASVMEDTICIRWDPGLNISYDEMMNIISKLILMYVGIIDEVTIKKHWVRTINGIPVEYKITYEKRRYIRLEILIEALSSRPFVGILNLNSRK